MYKRLITLAFNFFLSLSITTSALFSQTLPLKAAEMNSEINGENSLGIVIEESSDNIDNSKISSTPDLGDEQAFPFIPGFGKNSGKD